MDVASLADVELFFIPAVIAIASAIISLLTTEEIIAISLIFVTTVIVIDQSDLISSINDALGKKNPEVVITEEWPGEEITIISADGVPIAVHNDRTNEASYFVDFETEVLRDLNQNDYYPVCKIDDNMMIAPVPITGGMASDIIWYDSPMYHSWTLFPENAMRIIQNGIMHVLPFYDECGMAEFPHWHSEDLHGGYGFSNSMSFFGLRYDDYEENSEGES